MIFGPQSNFYALTSNLVHHIYNVAYSTILRMLMYQYTTGNGVKNEEIAGEDLNIFSIWWLASSSCDES